LASAQNLALGPFLRQVLARSGTVSAKALRCSARLAFVLGGGAASRARSDPWSRSTQAKLSAANLRDLQPR